MKLKHFSIAAFSLLLAGTAMAQSVQLKAGVNLANITVSNSGRIDDSKTLTSFQVGLVGDLPLGTKIISFQPGILFTGKGAKTEVGSYTATTNPYYIEVPANLVFKLPLGKEGGLFVGAGPYGAIGIAGKNKVEGTSLGVNISNEWDIKFSNDDPTTTNEDEGAGFGIMRRFDYGLNGIAGIETKNAVLSVNYGYGLAKLQSGTESSDNDKNKHRVLSFAIGFKF